MHNRRVLLGLLALGLALAAPALADMRWSPEDTERFRQHAERSRGFWGALLASVAAALAWMRNRLIGEPHPWRIADHRARRRRIAMWLLCIAALLALYAFAGARRARADLSGPEIPMPPERELPVLLGLALSTVAAAGWALRRTRPGGWTRMQRAAIAALLAGVTVGYFVARSPAGIVEQREAQRERRRGRGSHELRGGIE